MSRPTDDGTLVVCATPIGNLEDVSLRLAHVLRSADVILAEDTRRARILLNHLGITKRPVAYHAGNEGSRSGMLGAALASGQLVALVTDAGTPTVSDPGLSAVRVARQVGAEVTVVPGPSAALAALAISGLGSDRFVFEGFLPRKGRERSERLAALTLETGTMILFSATARVGKDLASLVEALGEERRVAVCRELTKVHEETWVGTLSGAVEEWRHRTPKGEFTLVIEGSPGSIPPLEAAVHEVTDRIGSGCPMSEAVRLVADGLGIGRRTLYEATLRADY